MGRIEYARHYGLIHFTAYDTAEEVLGEGCGGVPCIGVHPGIKRSKLRTKTGFTIHGTCSFWCLGTRSG
jgi:hypothetical protein